MSQRDQDTLRKTQELLQELRPEVSGFLKELLRLEREYLYQEKPRHAEIRARALSLLRAIVK
jgi:hypothetical protein